METKQTLDGALHNSTKTEALSLCRLLELGQVVPGDAAHKTDGQIRTTIGYYILLEELIEIADDELADGLIVEMAVDELRERCEKTIGQRLTVDTFNHRRHRKTCFLLKTILDFF